MENEQSSLTLLWFALMIVGVAWAIAWTVVRCSSNRTDLLKHRKDLAPFERSDDPTQDP